MKDITYMLDALGRGDACASESLLPLVYEELRRQAAWRMGRETPGQTLQPTALVHEAWLRLMDGGERRWQNRAHFFGAASEAMRRILIETARRKACVKRGGDQPHVGLDSVELAEASPEEKILMIDEALQQLRACDPQKATIVVHKFYGGLSNQEVAQILDVTERTIERHWAYAKAWLFQQIRRTGAEADGRAGSQ